MKRSASSETVGVPRSAAFWLAGSCPWATAPRMTLARSLACSGAIGVAPDGCTAPCARPIDHHVGLGASRPHADAEADRGVIPYCELTATRLKGRHRALGDPLGWHGLD